MWDLLDNYFWHVTVGALDVIVASCATLHAVVQKRESRTILGWVGLIWLTPLLGTFLYYCFGINRIERRGRLIHNRIEGLRTNVEDELLQAEEEAFKKEFGDYNQLRQVVENLTQRGLEAGNSIEPLVGGEHAYPAMLAAIEEAENTIVCSTYIFDFDRAGHEFIKAFLTAQKRGVQVRVLVDSVGSRYSWPTAVREMKRQGIHVATFLPTLVPRLPNYANLRNHRKIMVIDGKTGFTGGMNVRAAHHPDWTSKHTAYDIHFQLRGPVVRHLNETFMADWSFSTGEILSLDWCADQKQEGEIWARGITDGPDSDLDHIRLTMLAAIAQAQHSVTIQTPYFLPDEALIAALNVAAMRGVDVRVLLPSANNILLVKWACNTFLPELLQRGVKIFQSPPPFDHSKLFLIDDAWSLIGSTNWDPRSLRLNFEFNVECYSREFNAQLKDVIEKKLLDATPVSIDDIESRPLFIRVRDGIARLATPYL